jgi:hypothetical protein
MESHARKFLNLLREAIITRNYPTAMKTETKKSRNLYLQTRNNRWKWMAGATAATAAGVTSSQANTITINLVGNYIGVTFDGGNNLNADLTGDGHPDLTVANAFSYRQQPYNAGVTLNGVQASCHWYDTGAPNGVVDALMRLGSRVAFWHRNSHPSSGGIYTTSGTRSLMGSIPIFFKDLHINGGAPTRGSLEVTVSGTRIQLDSLTYTSTTPVKGETRTVPDQGSSLALLAMGASGILAFRRWRATQGRS